MANREVAGVRAYGSKQILKWGLKEAGSGLAVGDAHHLELNVFVFVLCFVFVLFFVFALVFLFFGLWRGLGYLRLGQMAENGVEDSRAEVPRGCWFLEVRFRGQATWEQHGVIGDALIAWGSGAKGPHLGDTLRPNRCLG